ncbi:MAG: ACP S-malonyltransferase [Brevinemataceae bacterium]
MVFFFPGQGSQFVGMGKDLCEKFPIAKEIFSQANDLLNLDIQNICFEGPEAVLTDTKITQPAVLTYQYILIKLLEERNITPTAAVGHSLGEFSALLASRMLDFSTTLRLVQTRAELMANADPEHKGSMAVILGLSAEQIIEICSEISKEHYVEAANFNTPEQTVISGLKEGVEAASAKALELKAKRVLPLKVSGAFHSKLMSPAADQFTTYIEPLVFNKPICPVISNVTGTFYDENTVKTLLPLQMKSSVQWVKSIELLSEYGSSENKEFLKGIELSKGSIISGMIKKINKEFVIDSIDSYIS